MQGAKNDYYNPSTSRGNPYSDIFGENPDGGYDTPSSVKLLGPLAPILLSDGLSDTDALQKRLKLYASSLLGVSAFFWLWAVYNTIGLRSKGGFDLGTLSFLGSAASSSLLLRTASGGTFGFCRRRKEKDADDEETDFYGRKSRRGDDDAPPPPHVPPGRCLRTFALLTQLAVVANYGLGVLFAFTAGNRVYVYFATYCVAFAVLWSAAAFVGWALADAYRAALRRAKGDAFVDGPPGGRGARGLLRGALIALTNRSLGHGGGAGAGGGAPLADGEYYPDEEDDIDDELRALYEGRGGYTNA